MHSHWVKAFSAKSPSSVPSSRNTWTLRQMSPANTPKTGIPKRCVYSITSFHCGRGSSHRGTGSEPGSDSAEL